MERLSAWLACCSIGFLSLSGCVGLEVHQKMADGMFRPDLKVELVSVSTGAGQCRASSAGWDDPRPCHTFVVRVTNNNTEQMMAMDGTYWEAITADGEVEYVDRYDGPVKLGPLEDTTLALVFAMGWKDTIVSLEFQPAFAETRVVVPVPPYETAP